jgi:alkylation response protein AidB-like acyl-CoA dehydrogenase
MDNASQADILDMLASSVSGFAKADPERVRRLRGVTPHIDREAWRKMAEHGWLAIIPAEECGGLGLGIVPAAVLARGLGRKALPEPFVPVAVLAAACLAAAPDCSARLADLMAGQLLVGTAWQDSLGSLSLDHAGVQSAALGSGFLLTGSARFVSVPDADAFIVYARGEAGLYWVPASTPGLAVVREQCADGSPLGWLSLNAVVAADARFIAGRQAANVLGRAVDKALVACSAELLGVMDSVLDLTLDYLRTRRQFGVPIGSNQTLQHMAVDMWISREITEAAVSAAAEALDNAGLAADVGTAAASGAKARASQAALVLCNRALQMHGAIGFAEEYGLGLFLNRALTLSAWLGNPAQHRRRFGRISKPDDRGASGAEVLA